MRKVALSAIGITVLILAVCFSCSFFGPNRSLKTKAVELCMLHNREYPQDTRKLWRWCCSEDNVRFYGSIVDCES